MSYELYQTQVFKDNETILTASMLNHIEEGIVNLETYFTSNKVELNSEGIVKTEQLPQNLLTTDNLNSSISSALQDAKNNGQFNGKDGITPIKGTHYWTDADKEEIIQEIINRIGNGNGVSY